VQQREHGLDINQALLDLAIDHAHEIERQIELHQDGVDHHETADGEHTAGDVAGREQHADDGPEREDHRLPGIQPPERGIGADCRPLVARHGGVEATRLVILIAEIFDRLVVKQAVDGLGMRLGVGIIHVAADGDAQVARPEGEPDIEADRDKHDHDIDPAEIIGHHPCDHGELDGGRDRVQHRHAHDGVDPGHAPLDDPVQTSGPALEMEAERQRVQMPEGALGELAHGMLGDGGEPYVAELREHHHHHPADAIGEDEEDRTGGKADRRNLLAGGLSGQQVDDRLVGDRHGERDDLGDNEGDKGPDHAPAEIGTACRPDKGCELPQDGEVPCPRLHERVAPRLRQVLHAGSLCFQRGVRAAKRGSVERYPSPHSI